MFQISRSLAHLSDDIKRLDNRLTTLFTFLDDLKDEQQQVVNMVTMLAYQTGGYYNTRGKREAAVDKFPSKSSTESSKPKAAAEEEEHQFEEYWE